MLSIFEYLRKRAYESVLSGAQEAVAYLDGKAGGSRPNSAPEATTVSTQPPDTRLLNPTNYLEGPSPIGDGQPEALPPPRRRGRPRHNRGEQG